MKPATTKQIAAINSILVKKGLMDDKPSIIASITNNRTTHSSELSFDEAKNFLSNLLSGAKYQPKNKMISKIFAMAHEMGWVEVKTMVDDRGQMTAKKDYSHVYAWIKKYGFKKTDLRAYQYNELPKLLTQFEYGPYRDYLRKL